MTVTVLEWNSATVPDHAIDFLGNVIEIDDIIVYPTGGTSARMVKARVVAIHDIRDVPDRKYGITIRDGYRGPAGWKIQVNRLQEGIRTSEGDGYRKIDDSRIVTIDQLHRVVSITALIRDQI